MGQISHMVYYSVQYIYIYIYNFKSYEKIEDKEVDYNLTVLWENGQKRKNWIMSEWKYIFF